MADSCCAVTDRAFSEAEARRAIRNYRRNGPAGQTRVLLDAISSNRHGASSLLDIGGGVGVIHHELLDHYIEQAVHVDASSAYLAEARAEAHRRGHDHRIQFIHADFSDVAATVPGADIVTLDRVVCCYPDFHRLLSAAAAATRGVLAMTYPRETWYWRLALSLGNAFQRLRREPFRGYIHSIDEMDRLLVDEGLQRVFLKRLFAWEVAVYQRP